MNKFKVEKRIFSGNFLHHSNEDRIDYYIIAPKNERQIAVRDAMDHAWKAYRTYAWGADEFQPLSKQPSVWFGLGLTIVDSIDTLYIMNMTDGLKELLFQFQRKMMNIFFRVCTST